MKKLILLFAISLIALNVNAQGAIRRDSSKDQKSTTARPSSRQKTNPLAIGRYASLKGYHSFTHEDGSIYEGPFNNGTLRGTVTIPGSIKMEGYFENGELEGRGKIYEADGSLAFSGVFSRGLPNGEGTLYMDGQAIYSKYWHDEFCAENVTFKMSETETFVGDFNGRVPWRGKIYSNNGVDNFWYDESIGTWRREPAN